MARNVRSNLGIALFALVGITSGFELKTTPQQVQSFLGNRNAKLVYSISDATYEGIYYVDLSSSPISPKRICTDLPEARSLIVSPDGNYIVYTLSGRIYIRTLMENSPSSDRRSICAGTFPKWWIHPDTDVPYIVFRRQTGNTGIFCQQLSAQHEQSGSPTKLFDDPLAGGGRSADGRFLAAHGFRYMWEIEPNTATSSAAAKTTVVFVHQEVGNCYGFMSPSKHGTDHHYGCVMHFNGGHSAIGIWRFAPDGKPVRDFGELGEAVADSSEPVRFLEIPSEDGFSGFGWKTCAWSTHEDYAVAIGLFYQSATQSYYRNLYIINLHTEQQLNVINTPQSGVEFTTPHLWVETSDIEPVGAVFVADPTRGTAPLSVSFDASASTGEAISYQWRFGDGATGTGATVNHTYTSANSYNARLIVSNGGDADTATTTITVDAAAPTVARIDIVPSSPVRVQYGTTQEFTAEAYDSEGTLIPDASITWRVRGNGGSAIEEEGGYTAGDNVGGIDTVIGSSGSVAGRCVVHVIGDPLTITSDLDGKSYKVGDTLTIAWTADTLRINRVTLHFTNDGGDNRLPIASGAEAISSTDRGQWGSYRWVIPESVGNISPISSTCNIMIRDYDEAYPDVFSDGSFTITANPSGIHGRTGKQGTPHCRLVGRSQALDIGLPAHVSYTITLMDIDGRCLLREERSGGGTVGIDLQPYGRGVYLLRIESRLGLYQTRVVDAR